MTLEIDANLRKLIVKQQRERFESLNKKEKDHFFNSLIEKDGHRKEIAQRIYNLFENGEAGSVEEALRIMRQEDDKSNKYPY